MKTNNSEIIRMENISKSFPGVKALTDVSISIEKGSVHGLIGENGAGKSTLIKTLMGVYSNEYNGEIYIDGNRVVLDDPILARKYGLYAVYQDVTLATHLTVGENFFLGKLPTKNGKVQWKKVYKESKEILDSLGINIDPKRPLNSLSIAQQEMASIAKALNENAKLVIFDEPTALLTKDDTKLLFSIIRKMKEKGIGIIYISHRLEELFEICDVVSVLKDGKYVGTKTILETNENELVNMMVGRSVSDMYSIEHFAKGENVLEVKNLSKKNSFKDISFTLKKGEILGFFGLVGSGRTEVMRCIFGADHYDSGQIFVNGKETSIKKPKDAILQGISLLPEDRKTQGLFLGLDCNKNINMAVYDLINKFGYIDNKKEKSNTEKYINALSIKTPSIKQEALNLSGGNQQKVIVARWLNRNSDIFIVDEPTVGIDVATKRDIYKILESLVREGKSIILISSYLPEILGLADRIVVIYEGKCTGIIGEEEIKITEPHILENQAVSLASGLQSN